MKKTSLLSSQDPRNIPPLTDTEIAIIKSVYYGRADEKAQQEFFELLLKRLCGIGDITFDKEQKLQDLKEGKRLVGLQLLYLVQKEGDA